MKVYIEYGYERPVIKCPKCKMTFCVDYIVEEKDEMSPEDITYFRVYSHQTCNDTYCFYCGHKLTKRNEVRG